MKEAARQAIRSVIRAGGRTRVGRFALRQMIENAMQESRVVRHRDVSLEFAAPNALCDWRAATFSTKEPETLEWIDAMPASAVLWDVGANVGLYATYAAKARGCRVWAFEPSIFNLELLARNVHMNGLTNQVCIVPLALSDAAGAAHMRMTTTEWGGALSTFGKDVGWDGQAVREVFEYQTIGLTMDEAVTRLGIPSPDYLKMDVDGIEHFILRGGGAVLARVSQVLIEINDDFHEQADQCRALLAAAGLTMREKRHSALIASSTAGFDHSFNQIWVRP